MANIFTSAAPAVVFGQKDTDKSAGNIRGSARQQVTGYRLPER